MSHNQAVIQKGSILLQQGRYVEAMEIFKDGLAASPDDDYLLYCMALAQYHIENQRSLALETINEALKHDTEIPNYYWLKSLILADLGKHKQALENVGQALEFDPQYSDAHAAKAYIHAKMEKWADAEKYAKESLAIDADNQFARNVLANALRMQNKLNEGAQLASDTLAKEPDDSMSHSNAGWIFLHKKDYQRAQEHFKEALRLDPNFEPARAGMLEAFKAKSLLYRWYLQYCLFMARQTKTIRIVIIVGLYVASKFMIRNFNTLFSGPLVVVGYIAIVSIYMFFFWSWLTGGIGNLLVWQDKMARYALNKKEKLDALFVGGGSFVGIALLAVAVFLKFLPLMILSISLIAATIPWSVTFTNDHKAGKIFYGFIAVYILLVGVVLVVGVSLFGGDIRSASGALKFLSGSAIVLFVLASWTATFGFLRK